MEFVANPVNIGESVVKLIIESNDPHQVGINNALVIWEQYVLLRLRQIVDTTKGGDGAAGRAITFGAKKLLGEILGKEGTPQETSTVGEAVNFLITQAQLGGAIPRPDAAQAVFDALLRDLAARPSLAGMILMDPRWFGDP